MARWTRVVGDGLVYTGSCLVKNLVLEAGDDERYVDVYDGRDATSGKLFARFQLLNETTYCYSFGDGVPFGRGIYIDAESGEENTTVVFEPL